MIDDAAGSPFHEGERRVQERAGVRERAERIGRHAVRDAMPDQHRALFAALPMLVAGAPDGDGRPRATLLAGPPGFVASPDPRTLTVAALPPPGDPLDGRLVPGAPVGLLGIELETRRRNRANGRIAAADAVGVTVAVEQSFGNCPQHIRPRAHTVLPAPPRPAGDPVARREEARLSAEAQALVAGADTFFIATASSASAAAAGVDVSHRGGPAGFVAITQEAGASVLAVPDYRGNNYFNTLGNLALNPAVGLLFVDFAGGGLLSLTGEAELVWQDAETAARSGVERVLRVRLSGGVFLPAAVPLRWTTL